MSNAPHMTQAEYNRHIMVSDTRAKRPFRMFVDSGNPDEPPPRAFRSLEAALRGFGEYNDYYRRFVWIIELRDEGEAIVHMRDGKDASAGVER